MANNITERIKLIVVGDGNCGKSMMLSMFKKDEVIEKEHIPTVFETYVHNFTVDNRKVELELCDTAGQEQYDRLRLIGYDRVNVVLLVYSIAEPASLENAVIWEKDVRSILPACPIILVGNKIDLRSDQTTRENLMEMNLQPVTEEDGRAMKGKVKAVEFLECSALENNGIQEVFEAAARTVLKQKEKRSTSFGPTLRKVLFSICFSIALMDPTQLLSQLHVTFTKEN